MASVLMDSDALKQWILRTLGAPLVRVEITDDQLNDCIEDSRRWFTARKGVKKQALMQLYSGQVEYDLPPEVDTVLDVAFPVPPMDISMLFSPFILIDEKVPYDVFAAPGSAGLYSSFTQTLQYVEMAKRVLGAEPDWRQEDRKLYIFPVSKVNAACILDCKVACTAIEQLSEMDHDLVKRYALCRAMARVGRVRSKYADFPAAQGTATLDGERLLEEAKETLEKLEEEISQKSYPIPFISG